MSEKIAEVKSLEEDVKLQEYSSKLYNLRKDGVNKVMSLQQEIQAAKRNKLLDADERNRMIADWSKQIVEARQIAAENRDEEKQIEKEAVAYSNSIASLQLFFPHLGQDCGAAAASSPSEYCAKSKMALPQPVHSPAT